MLPTPTSTRDSRFAGVAKSTDARRSLSRNRPTLDALARIVRRSTLSRES
tara:strand:- start:296 stop:445 length:150 start_codon:yes stop_codon:yes gene_type:complete